MKNLRSEINKVMGNIVRSGKSWRILFALVLVVASLFAVAPAQIARAVDEGRESLDLYLDEISRVPLLNREEEMALARRAFQGDVLAQERLARHKTLEAKGQGKAA